MRWRIADFGLPIVLLLTATGCASQAPRAATRPASELATTQPSYWLDQPGIATASAADFDRLFRACEDVAREYFFKLDRIDYRGGLLTTQPLVSAQFFEPWRGDARTGHDRDESSIATTRRTVHFEFSRVDETSWQVAPKVLVERQAISEKRITSVVRYRSAFGAVVRGSAPPRGTRESDMGVNLPERYWYPLRRDATLERTLAQAVQTKAGRTAS